MRKFIVFVESILTVQVCSTNKTLFRVHRHGKEGELFFYLCKHQIIMYILNKEWFWGKRMYNILAVSCVPCQDLVQFSHIAMHIRTVRILMWDDM